MVVADRCMQKSRLLESETVRRYLGLADEDEEDDFS